jgi:hypothetical protein
MGVAIGFRHQLCRRSFGDATGDVRCMATNMDENGTDIYSTVRSTEQI